MARYWEFYFNQLRDRWVLYPADDPMMVHYPKWICATVPIYTDKSLPHDGKVRNVVRCRGVLVLQGDTITIRGENG